MFDTFEVINIEKLKPNWKHIDEDLDDGVKYISHEYNFTTVTRVRRQLTKESTVARKHICQIKTSKQSTSTKKTIVPNIPKFQ